MLRLGAGCVLVAGLVAAWAVATGGFDGTDGRLIATSVGFGIFSAFAVTGAALAGGPERGWRLVVGASGVVSSIAAFILLNAALWLPDVDDVVWRWWATAGLVALWCWHAGAILGPRRDDDDAALVLASSVAASALGLDTLGAIAAVTGRLERPIDPALVTAFATVLIVAVASSVLVPLLRRLQRTREPAAPASGPPAAPVAAAASAHRDPPRTPAALWREGDPLTRALLGACAVVPILAGFALALAWPGSRVPATTRTVTVGSPPVTVTQVPPTPVTPAPVTVTQAPPARVPPQSAAGAQGDGFGAADSARIIARRRRAFDRQAAHSASALAPIVERCYARAEDFTACDTAVELPAAAAAGLSLGMGQAQVAVVASTVATYSIAAQSRTGATFTLSRDAAGALHRTCTPADTGGCRRGGTW